MAKVTFNQPITGVRGQIDGLVFRQMKDGSIVVSRKPDFSRRKPSKKQKDLWQGFRVATADAKSAQGHPLYIELAQAKGLNAYNVALSDRMKPPVIHQIQRTDGRILVQASDNVMVAKVEVQVLDEQKEIVEKGEATRGEDNWWEYVPKLVGKTITAAAWDLAGNVTKAIM